MKCLAAVNFHAFHDITQVDECLESLVNAIEIINKTKIALAEVVFFDSSNKDTSHLSAYKNKFANFKIIKLESTASGIALNKQIEYAIANNYDVFFRVDADDVTYENRFLLQANYLNENEDIDICGGGLDYYNLNTGESFPVLPNQDPTNLDYILNRYCLHPTFAMRVSVFKTGLRYWEKRIEDKQLILKARINGLKFANIPEVLGKYYIHNGVRRFLKISWLSLKLNLSWSWNFKKSFITVSVMVFIIRVLLSVKLLRKWRNWI